MTGGQATVGAARIAELLATKFTDTPVLTWWDEDGAYAAELDAIAGAAGDAGVELTVHRVSGDEFGVKHRVYAALDESGPAGGRRHLIYRTGPIPAARDDWLLDLAVGYGRFSADTTAILVDDLGLGGRGVDEVVGAHSGVFADPDRTERVQTYLAGLPADLPADALADHLRAAMSAAVLGLDGSGGHRLHRVVEELFGDLVAGSSDGYMQLERFGLDGFLWSGVARIYGYAPDNPTVAGLANWLFDQAWHGWPDARNGARIDFDRLRGERALRPVFGALARLAQDDLNVADRLRADPPALDELAAVDLFPVVDEAVLDALTTAVLARTVPADRVAAIVRERAVTTWFDDHEAHYRAVEWAADALHRIETFRPDIADPADGVRRYAEDFSRIDRAYRCFRACVRRAQQPVRADLIDRLERAYVHDYQRPLAEAWQTQVDSLDSWRIPGIEPLGAFARYDLLPERKTAKTLVIVSDALRYEVGAELAEVMNADDWFTATIAPRLAPLPSFTQLGMASHLPHDRLEIIDGRQVRADDRPTGGTPHRAALWEQMNVAALRYDQVNDMPATDLAALWSEHAAIVVYHDVIDLIGDKPGSERDTPRAAAQAIDEIAKLIRRFGTSSFRATRVLVTADHGFLFQDSEVEPVDELSEPAHGDEIVAKNRRYVLGRGLREHPSFTTWSSAQLGLAGDLQVQIPRGVHRLRLPGAGLRFVHGGATLQEVVVPLVTLARSRKAGGSKVEMSISVGTATVTTSDVLVTLIQREAVTGKRRGRTFQVGVWAGDRALSNLVEVEADSPAPDIRDRHRLVELVLGEEASEYNGQTVEVRALEKVNDAYIPCGLTTTVTLQRGFGGFFDAL